MVKYIISKRIKIGKMETSKMNCKTQKVKDRGLHENSMKTLPEKPTHSTESRNKILRK